MTRTGEACQRPVCDACESTTQLDTHLLGRKATSFNTMQSTRSYGTGAQAQSPGSPHQSTSTCIYVPGDLAVLRPEYARIKHILSSTMPTLLCFKSRRAGKGHATTEIPDQTQNHRTVSTKWKFLSHRSTALQTNQKPRVSNHQTHLNLINALQLPPTNAQIAALARLQTLFALPKHRTTFSTFSSIITDLDTVLFSNLLSPHTIFEWVLMSRQIRGITLPYDFSRSGISMVHIRLNKTMFRLEAKEEIWGTVLHEMLHAYLDLTTGWGELRVPHHGELFEQSCGAMVRRLGLVGLEVGRVV